MRVGLKPLLLLVSPLAIALAAAWLQWGIAGVPPIPRGPALAPGDLAALHGFPSWLRLAHALNFLLLSLLIRSGLQILMDHPRLYSNVHCTPGTEWLRLTPVEVPRDRVWTSKDDSRPLSPWIGLPGHRHTVGMARHWHFVSAMSWVVCGLAYVALLFGTGQWVRLVPTSWRIVPDAWAIFVRDVTFHVVPGPGGSSGYDALQQLSYFGVVFVLAPLAILTGPSMSPAFTARFAWYPQLPGNRQVGRSLHFLVMCAFLVFIAVHVTMVAVTGLARNMNHIALGTDGTRPLGLYAGLAGIVVVILLNALAHHLAWRHPRAVQHAAKVVVSPAMRLLQGGAGPLAEFERSDISPYFWINGRMPTCDEWTRLAEDGFRSYRLRVHGLVENPVELSLEDLRALVGRSQITLHHCIQGWSGIAEWGGVPLVEIVRLVRPEPRARAVVFHSFGDGVEFTTGVAGGPYYDSLSIEDAVLAQTLLAYDMNRQPLAAQHGAPLRLRVENQLGFKMVKWIRAIEFVESIRSVGEGEGGYAEDHEYFGERANI